MPRPDPRGMSVRELKRELSRLNVNYSDCVERAELTSRLEQAHALASASNTAGAPAAPAT